MSPEVARSIPPYLQIAEDVASRIRSGQIAEGGAIPSARQIASTWNVAIATATKAHAHLRTIGLVRAVPGVGTVVSTGGTNHGAQQRGLATRDRDLIYGQGEVAEILSAATTIAPDHVAAALGLPGASEVLRRERITRQHDVPVSASVSWFAGDLIASVPELLVPERILQGTFSIVAERLGRSLASGREEVAASQAEAGEAGQLGLEVGNAVLRSRNWFFDQDGGVIEYGESVRRPDRWSVHVFRLT